MADSTLSIRVRALVEGLADVARLSSGLNNTADAAGGASDKAKGTAGIFGDLSDSTAGVADAIEDMIAKVDPLDSLMANLSDKAKTLVSGFIALAGVMALKEAADVAARTETLGVTLAVVANNAGYTKDQISQYENQLKSLGITTGAARESLIQLIQAGINLNQVNSQGASKAAELARAAQDLAVVTGENSSDTLSRLILNIRQLDTEGLRYLGLSVDVQAAQERFAQSIGKSADALSQQQKQQAVMNAALQEAQALAGAYEASLGTVGKQLGSMSRYQTEAANSVGNLLLPAYGELVKNATEFLKVIAEAAEQIAKTSNFATTFAAGVGNAATALTTVLNSTVQLIASITPAFGLMVKSVGEVVDVIGDIVNELVLATAQTGALVTITESLALLIAGLADGIQIIRAAVSLIASGWEGLLSILTTGLSQIVSLVDKELGASLDALAARLMVASQASKASSDKIFDDFSAGNTAVQRLIASTTKASDKLKEFGKATNFGEVEEQIRKLTAAQRDNTVNSVEAVEAGNKIRTSIEELGRSAVITDSQASKLTAKLGASLSGVAKQYQETIKALDLTLTSVGGQNLFASMSKESREMSGRLQDLAANAMTTGVQFQQAFAMGIDGAKTVSELESISRALTTARQRWTDTSQSAAEARIQFDALFTGNLDSTRTVADLDVMKAAVKALGDQGILSGTALADAFTRIGDRAKELTTELSNADLVSPLAALGFTLENLSEGLSESGKIGVQAFSDIANAVQKAGANSVLTGDQLLKVFNSSLGSTQTLQDLESLSKELKDANTAGVVFGQTYKDALSEAARKFDELFQAQLKTTDTRTEYNALTAQVKEMGAAGTISGTQMTLALDAIREKASGAREQILALAQQATSLATAQVAALRASTSVDAASLNVEQQKKRLVDLTTQARRNNSKELQAQIRYQEAIVRQAQAEQRQAEARYRLEQAQVKALIASQKELNAEKRVEANPGDKGLQAAADVAAREADQKELVVEKNKEAVAQTELLVAATEKAVQQAKEYAEQMGVAVESTSKTVTNVTNINGQSGQVSKAASAAIYTAESVSAQLQEAGFSVAEADRMGRAMLGSSKGVAAFGSQGIAAWGRIADRVKSVIANQQTMAEKAQEVTDKFQRTADEAGRVEQGLSSGYRQIDPMIDRTSVLAVAMQQVRDQAEQINKASQDAVKGFSSSAASLQIELLNAQGRSEEATKRQYAIRQKDLALEYQMLQAKIQSAMVTAEAAGISTADLQRQMSDASKAYNQSRADLRELEKIDEEKARKQDEQARKERQDQASLTEQKISDISRVSEASEGRRERTAGFLSDFTTNLVADMPGQSANTDLQSIAKDIDLTPSKKVVVDFTSGEKVVSSNMPEDDATALLTMLDQARKRS